MEVEDAKTGKIQIQALPTKWNDKGGYVFWEPTAWETCTQPRFATFANSTCSQVPPFAPRPPLPPLMVGAAGAERQPRLHSWGVGAEQGALRCSGGPRRLPRGAPPFSLKLRMRNGSRQPVVTAEVGACAKEVRARRP
ncbi:hypothetical protein FKM82_020749 [Ascaphus truei]